MALAEAEKSLTICLIHLDTMPQRDRWTDRQKSHSNIARHYMLMRNNKVGLYLGTRLLHCRCRRTSFCPNERKLRHSVPCCLCLKTVCILDKLHKCSWPFLRVFLPAIQNLLSSSLLSIHIYYRSIDILATWQHLAQYLTVLSLHMRRNGYLLVSWYNFDITGFSVSCFQWHTEIAL